ncbi:Pectinesterase [Melia azedarach]|uniref:Pectinesterase n=1 Tax=Melia azedarach TaxID=155640 RepID=A0ACC1YFE4_MELAZ|nr:Pectinesterase [Melia azedarach]
MNFGNEAQDNKKKKITIISIASLVLVAMVVGAAVGISRNSTGGDSKPEGSGQIATSSKAIRSICQPTDYRQTCETSLTKSAPNETDPKELIKVGFRLAMDEIKAAMKNSTTLKEAAKDPRTKQALENCQHLMDYAVDDLNNSVTHMGAFDIAKVHNYVENLRVWLTGAITFQESCVYEFQNITGSDAGDQMKNMLNTSRELTANGLDMVTDLSSVIKSFNSQNTQRRLFSEDGEIPSWVSEGRRRLLAETRANIKPDVIVAQDGSGKYKTISEALKYVPVKNPMNKTFVIYIKEGIYSEYVTVTKQMNNVMFIGDGPTKTKVTGNKNYADGTQTMNTATVAIVGPNFMAKDMGFENTAGAEKHQAVALRVQSDNSVFYNCQMDAFQDTLYVHAHRQFYRDCTISGTIDFVFGDAAAVLQNCKLIIRKPMKGQSCIVTAQGRTKDNAVSGIVLQNCTITGEKDYYPVKNKNKAYLGRPWKEFSRTIVMQSDIEDIIQPEGWLPWNGDFALNTSWYAEFRNRGTGSVQTKRVTWQGIKKITPEQAADFTVGKFYTDEFIKPTGVPYTVGMMNV